MMPGGVLKVWWRHLLYFRRYRLKRREGAVSRRPPPPSTGLSVAALTELLVILQRSGIASGNISFLPAPDPSLNMQAEF